MSQLSPHFQDIAGEIFRVSTVANTLLYQSLRMDNDAERWEVIVLMVSCGLKEQ